MEGNLLPESILRFFLHLLSLSIAAIIFWNFCLFFILAAELFIFSVYVPTKRRKNGKLIEFSFFIVKFMDVGGGRRWCGIFFTCLQKILFRK